MLVKNISLEDLNKVESEIFGKNKKIDFDGKNQIDKIVNLITKKKYFIL